MLIVEIVEKVGSDSSIDVDPQKSPSNFVRLMELKARLHYVEFMAQHG